MREEKQPAWWQVSSRTEGIAVVVGLTAACALGRFLLDQPNFKPSMAAALLAGAILRDWRLAILVPLVSLSLTDWWLGSYEWPLMATVYVCLAAPVFWSRWLDGYFARGRWEVSTADRKTVAGAGPAGPRPAWLSAVGRFLGWNAGAVLGAIVFYLLTSWVVWASTPWYDPTWAGLLQCYAAALPFLKWMLHGNLVFLNSLLVVWLAYRFAATLTTRAVARPAVVRS